VSYHPRPADGKLFRESISLLDETTGGDDFYEISTEELPIQRTVLDGFENIVDSIFGDINMNIDRPFTISGLRNSYRRPSAWENPKPNPFGVMITLMPTPQATFRIVCIQHDFSTTDP
jgi:hypothetical protein